jgi:molybdopterin-containing oxidoreductase family membrane subunit
MSDFQKREFSEKKAEFQELVVNLTKFIGKPNKKYKIWIAFLSLLIGLAAIFYTIQVVKGLGVTDMRDISSWGLYIADFVFLIAVSLIGSLITAILKLANVKWATPLTRISEIIAVGGLVSALLIIVVDMGRPDRLWHIFIYGRLQSPILWDIIVVNTYLVISILLLYLPLIPDIAIMRKNEIGKSTSLEKLYKILSLGWQGSDLQHKLLKRGLAVLMIIIIPVAFSIHTVTSWLFASTLRIGWDSTIFGPYFVSGAFMVGTAAVLCAMFIIRWQYKYEDYITDYHFNMVGKLLVLTSLLYLYFNLNEYLVPAYKIKSHEGDHLTALFTGEFSATFWFVQLFGMIIPIILMIFKPFRNPKPLFIISIAIIVGAFLKRYLIITPTLLHPFLPIQNYPDSYHHYSPTISEIMITIGSIALVLLIITLFMRIFPIIPIVETAHDKEISNEIINS